MASQHVRDSQMGHSTATFTAPTHEIGHGASLAALVFGDIGTSPLYTLKECLHAAGGQNAKIPDDLFGILSFMFWALVLVVTVKYLIFVMRADHDGEGDLRVAGSCSRTLPKDAADSGKVTGMALLAVIGAALLYGDGVITLAISVLSAVEGLKVASPNLEPLVLPLTCGILVALFAIQRRGTGDIGKLFGPVMAVWFITMAGLGIYHVIQKPEILTAFAPSWRFVLHPKWTPQDAHSWLCRPGRDRGRSVIRRHGTFWHSTDSYGMDVFARDKSTSPR